MRLLQTLFVLLCCTIYGCQSDTSTSVSASIPKSNAVASTVRTVKDSTPDAILETPVYPYTLEELIGKFEPAQHPDFVKMDNKYTDRPNLYLRKAAYDSYKKMHAAAQAAGIKLVIRSAARNFDYQKGIWERKWTGKTKIDGQDISKTISDPVTRAQKILLYSSMPGTSRHHWGTDIDLNSFNNEYFESGVGKKVYEWLVENAPQYGFCQPYIAKGEDRPNGYEEEKWHWSYLPIAQPLTDLAAAKLKDQMIQGFKGAATAKEIGVVEKYVLGIADRCRH
ncbi:MAG: M15 family metallopeptidase [Bacteroidota bacterium]